LQQSVPTTSDVQATFVATLVDEWCRLGLRDAVISPGSRSTPLALALHRRSDVRVHVRIDERSAAFFALGRALATRRPVAVVVTSGTAAAEVHAAVAEADLARVGLMILTADRPPELHGVGAPQTIDQRHLYGSMVRVYEEPGVARREASMSWRPLAQRLWRHASGAAGLAGPVHLNAAFVEPLLGESLELPAAVETVGDVGSALDRSASAAELVVNGQRVLCVVGAGVSAAVVESARRANWVVVGDATAVGAVALADPLVRHDEIWRALRPDVIVRLGGLPASKFLAQRLATCDVPVVGLEGCGPVADPDGVVHYRLAGRPDPTLDAHRADAAYAALWQSVSDELADAVASWWDDELDEVLVARLVVQAAHRHDAALVVGSSMPVRDVEWWSESRRGPVYANRGANGIDGVVSTFLGVASGARALGLVGDVTMLHDVSALVEGAGAHTHAVLVVNDNGGGGIFSFLAQARELPADQFGELFATSRDHDLVAIAHAFGHYAQRVGSATALRRALDDAVQRPGLSVVVAMVPSRDANVARHDELNARVGQWWRQR